MKWYSVLTVVLFVAFTACTSKKEKEQVVSSTNEVKYATGFSIENYNNFTLLKITKPWPNATTNFTYVCAKDAKAIPDSLKQFTFIQVPLKNVVVTSTTHISSMVNLKEESQLVGFPHTDYISSKQVRTLIDNGVVKDLGDNENLNFEKTLDVKPNAIIALSIDDNIAKFEEFVKAGIPVVYNADWVENTPLGKAEWIKFFGVLFDQQEQATSFFDQVVNEYNETKKLVKNITNKPTVLSGGLYQDVWYAPQGESWMATFINDAKGSYVWGATKGTGSLSLSLEMALEKGDQAEFWIGPSSYSTYDEMLLASNHYRSFQSFQNKKIYSFALKTGQTGGVLFYEDAPNRPDLVLKDIIYVLHPKTLKNYQPTYIQSLK